MPHIRYQLPAYSPVTVRSLWMGLRALLGSEALAEVTAILDRRYAPRAVALTDSGTSALRLAIESSLRLRPGRVAIPAYSCYDVSSAAEGSGAEVLLYDVDPSTLGPDFGSLEDAIRFGANIVVVVHLYGIPVDMGALDELRHRHGVIVIEDAAQGFGATYGGKPVGTLGDLSVLSFARGKGVTGGGGGALLGHSAELAPIVDRSIREANPGGAGLTQLARAMVVWFLARPELYTLAASMSFLRLGETIYRSPSAIAGMSRSALGVLSETLHASEIEAEARKRNAAELLEHIRNTSQVSPIEVPANAESAYLRLPVLAQDGWKAGEIERARNLGIAAGYPRALADLPSCREICANVSVSFPGARQLARCLATLPTHSRLRPRDKRAIIEWIARGPMVASAGDS